MGEIRWVSPNAKFLYIQAGAIAAWPRQLRIHGYKRADLVALERSGLTWTGLPTAECHRILPILPALPLPNLSSRPPPPPYPPPPTPWYLLLALRPPPPRPPPLLKCFMSHRNFSSPAMPSLAATRQAHMVVLLLPLTSSSERSFL
jgi:hypothetical protein